MNLTWDSDNKLRSADIDANGTADVNFQYDALGRRVARSGTGGSVVYVQMDQQTIADYPVGGAATTPTFRYVYASYIDEPVVRKTAGTGGTLVYFHRNHQYSVTAITTSTGTISERYAYTAYGQPTILNTSGTVISATTLSNRYSYTGREWDATLGLHHFRARWMSPSAGKFLGRDPIGFLDGMNLYGIYFVLSGADPSGLESKTFDIVAKSFINGAKPAGFIIPDRPGFPPGLPGGGITPIHNSASDRLRFFANLVAQLPAFNQNPMTSVKDGIYRLYTRVVVTVDCCGDEPYLEGLETDMDGGKESDPPIGWPSWLQPPIPIKGTINLSPLNVTYPNRQTLNVDWRGWGQPNLVAEPGMQWVAIRTSFNIWHWPDIYFKCSNGVPFVSSAAFAGASNFPSHRLWVDGAQVANKRQGTLSDLWVDHPLWFGFVQ
jgi:RHS repeat-associated protein